MVAAKKVPYCGKPSLYSTVAGILLYPAAALDGYGPAASLDGYGPPACRPRFYSVSQLTLLEWALSA